MNADRNKLVSTIQTHLKGASINLLEIEELLIYQEHLIQQQEITIAQLRNRIKELEGGDCANEHIARLKTIEIQLKAQNELLKIEVQEKDNIIHQLQSKSTYKDQNDLLQNQEIFQSQNMSLQNMIYDLQTQILSKDTIIGQLKSQDKTLDNLIAQLNTSVTMKSTKVDKNKLIAAPMGVLDELQQYPEALQNIVQKIQQEYNRMKNELLSKEAEISALKSQQVQQQLRASQKIVEIKTAQRDSFSVKQEQQVDDLVGKNLQMEDMIHQLEQKLLQSDSRKRELQLILMDTNQEIEQLEKSEKVESITPQFSKITSELEIKHNDGQLIQKQQSADNLIKQHLQLDDIILNLEQKLVNKQFEQQELIKHINLLENDDLETKLNNIQQSKQQLQQQIESETKKIDQLTAEIQTKQSKLQQLQQIVNDEQQTQNKQPSQQQIVQQQQLVLQNTQLNAKIAEQQKEIERLKQQNSIPLPSSSNDETKIHQETLIRQLRNQVDSLKFEIEQKEELFEQQLKLNEKQEKRRQEQFNKAELLSGEIRQSAKEQQPIEKYQQADELVRQHLALDDLILDLETKLSAKVQKRRKLSDIHHETTMHEIQEQLQESNIQIEVPIVKQDTPVFKSVIDDTQVATEIDKVNKEKKALMEELQFVQNSYDIILWEVNKKKTEVLQIKNASVALQDSINQIRRELDKQNKIQSDLTLELVKKEKETSEIQQNVNKKQRSQVNTSPSKQREEDNENALLKDTINQLKSQIEFMKFELNQKEQLYGYGAQTNNEQLSQKTDQNEVSSLLRQRSQMDQTIQQLQEELQQKTRVKSEIQKLNQSQDSFEQSQLANKNQKIVELHEEIHKLQKQLQDQQDNFAIKEVDIKYQALMKRNQQQCESADELVGKNLAMDDLIHNLELKLVQKESKVKELELMVSVRQNDIDSSVADIQEARDSYMVKSIDQSQDSLVQAQQSAFQTLGNKIETMKFEIQEKDKLLEQQCKTIAEVKKMNYNQTILASQDLNDLESRGTLLKQQADNLVEQNLAMEELIHDLEFKYEQKLQQRTELEQQLAQQSISSQSMAGQSNIKQSPQPGIQSQKLTRDETSKFEIFNSASAYKQSNSTEQLEISMSPHKLQPQTALQQKQDQSDDLVRKNIELDEILLNLEKRLAEKQQQQTSLEQQLQSQRERSSSYFKPLQIFQEEASEEHRVSSKHLMEVRSSQHQSDDMIILEHNQQLDQLNLQIGQLTNTVQQIAKDEDNKELEELLKEKQAKSNEIDQVRMFIQTSDDLLQDLKDQVDSKKELVDKINNENEEVQRMILQLQEKQNKLVDQAISINQTLYNSQQNDLSNAENTTAEIQLLIQQNLEQAGKQHDLEVGARKLKHQIASLESLILDLQIQVKQRQDDLTKTSQDNLQLTVLLRKQKQKRDQFLKEQQPLSEKVGLLEYQVRELDEEQRILEEELQLLFKQFQQAQELKNTKEEQVSTLKNEFEQLEQLSQQLSGQLITAKQNEQQLTEELQKYKESNSLLEHQVTVYSQFSKESCDLDNKIADISKEVELKKQTLHNLEKDYQEVIAQILEIQPQLKDSNAKHQLLTSKYVQLTNELAEKQKQLLDITNQKNEFQEETNYLQLFIANQQLEFTDLQTTRMLMEDRIKQEKFMKNALLDNSNRVATELDKYKANQQQLQQELTKIKSEKQLKEDQLKQYQNELKQLKQKVDTAVDQEMKYKSQVDIIKNLEQKLDNQIKVIYDYEGQLVEMQQLWQQKQTKLQEYQKQVDQVKDEFEFLKRVESELREQIVLKDQELTQLEKEQADKEKLYNKLEAKLHSLQLEDLEQKLLERTAQFNKQADVIQEIEYLTNEVMMLEESKQRLASQLTQQQKAIEQNLFQITEQAKQIEQQGIIMKANSENIAMESKKLDDLTVQLEKINDQFRKIDEEVSMMQGVIVIKEKELRQFQIRKEMLIKTLEEHGADIQGLQKQVINKKKLQKSTVIEESQQEQEDFQLKLGQLDQQKVNILDDLKLLVSKSPDKYEDQENSQLQQDQAQQMIRDREKRIETLEQTIQTLINQNVERGNAVPSMFQSKISVQPSFYMDDDPYLLELQDKFTKESELLQDLQAKLKLTADRHHELAVKLQEYAEQEHRLADELDTRIKNIEGIENDLQSVTQRQFDMESQKVGVLQRIYQLETETQDMLEQENLTKTKLKEKKDYIQNLVKTLIETDEKLVQLRNRMALYTQEARHLTEQVDALENEKESKLASLQSIQEELEAAEMEKGDKIVQLQQIRQEITGSQKDKERLEGQWAQAHGKIQQLKTKIGVEESVYQRLLSEVEKLKRKDEIKYQGLFNDSSSQTYHETDQFEILFEKLLVGTVQVNEIDHLKQKSKLQLQALKEQIGAQLETQMQENSPITTMLKQQQILISILESENQLFQEQGPIMKSQSPNKQNEKAATEDCSYYLEQINFLLQSTKEVEVHLSKQFIEIEGNKVPRVNIINTQFDYNNDNYPLGVVHVVYQLTQNQVIGLSLTGTKAMHLYQKL